MKALDLTELQFMKLGIRIIQDLGGTGREIEPDDAPRAASFLLEADKVVGQRVAFDQVIRCGIQSPGRA